MQQIVGRKGMQTEGHGEGRRGEGGGWLDGGLVILGGRKGRRRVRGSWVVSRGGLPTMCPGKEVQV
jgi:hypothetical protein